MSDNTMPDPVKRVLAKKTSREISPGELEFQRLAWLCGEGRLFEVQDWIASGKPVNPPHSDRKGTRPHTPLRIAIESGFHSLVEVLLDAGADMEIGKWNGPMDRALRARNLGVVQLMVQRGYPPSQINAERVFESWDPELMEFCIELGIDVQSGNPLAKALCERVQTALRVLKRYRERFPHFQEEADIALRHHAAAGDLKWVSLMLWAGADPLSVGFDRPDIDPELYKGEDQTAVEYAASHDQFEAFTVKRFVTNLEHPAWRNVLKLAIGSYGGGEIASRLLELGVPLNDQSNGGCSAMQWHLSGLNFCIDDGLFGSSQRSAGVNTISSRRHMAAVLAIAKNGGKWIPETPSDYAEVRRGFRNVTADHLVEFVATMRRFGACSKAAIVELTRTPAIKRHIADEAARVGKILKNWPSPKTD